MGGPAAGGGASPPAATPQASVDATAIEPARGTARRSKRRKDTKGSSLVLGIGAALQPALAPPPGRSKRGRERCWYARGATAYRPMSNPAGSLLHACRYLLHR